APDYLQRTAGLLYDCLLDVIRAHEPDIERVLRGGQLPAGAPAELVGRAIQAQGTWFQLLSIAEQNAAMRQRRQAEVERGPEQVRAWGLYFVHENLFGIVPELADKLEQALGRAYPDASFDVPPFFQVGCWIGGDRDGNPFVTNDATRRTLCETRVASLRRYRLRLAALLGAASIHDRTAVF